jgi:hypothetical protein
MAGRQPRKVYVYEDNGTYVCMFDNMVDFRKVYYPNDIGKRPLFVHKELGFEYHYMEDLELIATTDRSAGRDLLKRIIAIHNSEFCKKEDNESSKKPIEVFNLKNELIAEFKNSRLLLKMMPHIAGPTLSSQLNNDSIKRRTYTECGLFFKYKEL